MNIAQQMIEAHKLKFGSLPPLQQCNVSGNALFNADCMDILPLIPDKSVQLILADLPNGKPRTNKVKNGVMGKLTDSSTKKVIEYNDNGLRYPTQVLKIQRDILKSNLHPTQKPLELMKYMILTYSNENDCC